MSRTSLEQYNIFNNILKRILFYLVIFVFILGLAAYISGEISASIIDECYERGEVYYRYEGIIFGTTLVETTKENSDITKIECVEGILLNGEKFRK